ncbi:MAG: adenosylmethionine--8-amino-7-oxononanoate transaminase [Chitinophagales bacterium]|nr:adenosylmethionine--8-amino-7-oxononanoate transaminase [Chitinophagales bacterium]
MNEPNGQYPIWHPYTQMQTAGKPLKIVRGEGAYLYDEEGNRYIDAVSSWWTNLHGHAHPHIAQAIAKQAQQLEQVIFAGFTHKPAIQLAEKLLQCIRYHSKVFYSDNGSTAVEAAVKMALQFWWNKGEERKKIIAFRDAYHGDTFGAMSISARGVFTSPYRALLFDVLFADIPVSGNEEQCLQQFKSMLNENKNEIAAFIFEPLVLGSAGMLMYKPAVLDELLKLCEANNIITIADEVMTGFGRTGKFLATDYCSVKPNIICLSKGITGGFLPFAATTCSQKIYDAFLSDEKSKMLFHGHSYTGNPLGCSAAIASLEVFETEDVFSRILLIEKQHTLFSNRIKNHASVKEVRHTGTILAIELKTETESGYLNTIRDKAYSYFMERKIILRPLGNVVYVLPPYCISEKDLAEIYAAIEGFLSL